MFVADAGSTRRVDAIVRLVDRVLGGAFVLVSVCRSVAVTIVCRSTCFVQSIATIDEECVRAPVLTVRVFVARSFLLATEKTHSFNQSPPYQFLLCSLQLFMWQEALVDTVVRLADGSL